ncbi:MAG: hypothetical protein QHH13_14225, partial [Melioribacter sp.]|nr:hypothetical protein [Melioribacter sp.]
MKLFIHLFTISLIFILGCEKISESVIEQELINTTAEIIQAPDNFNYSSSDSTFVTSIKLSNKEFIENVWLRIKFYDGSSTIHQQIFMSDEGDLYLTGDEFKGDNIYSALVPMSKKFPGGKYAIEYFAQYKNLYSQESSLKLAVHYFNYTNSQINLPPSITEVIVPSTASYDQKITLMVKVNDPNGLKDISSVYYELYKPDGSKTVNSQGISQFPLFDDGNTSSNGDAVANDGTYSVFLTFPSGQPSGQWRFEFYVKDKGGLISEKFIHYLT